MREGIICLKRLHTKFFLNRIAEKFDNIEALSEYQSAKKDVTFYCKIHDFVFNRTPDLMMRSAHGCPICATEHVASCKRKTHEEFLSEVVKVNSGVELLGKYKTMTDKIFVKCKKCGNTWNANPSTLLIGNGCKKCAMKYVQKLRIKTHEQFLHDIEETGICKKSWNRVAGNLV